MYGEEIGVFGDFGSDKDSCTGVDESVEGMVGGDLGLAVQ
jgi:hypothetical protein